jgi:phage shock protein C
MKKLYLSDKDKKVLGVVSGMAEYFEVDITLMRVLFIFVLIMTGFIPVILFYIVVALVIPQKPSAHTSKHTTENLKEDLF